MAVRRAVLTPVLIGSIASAAVIIIFYVFLQLDLQSKTEQLDRTKINLAQTLASRTELRLDNAVNLLEVTAKLPQVQDNSFSNLISAESKGIPPDADPEKRSVQKSILATHIFETVAFLMPNGDVYSVEPSIVQKNLQTVNFSNREYYATVMRSQSSYVSDILLSTATNHNTVVIATPVFEDGSQAGIWVGAMDLNVVNMQLRSLYLGPHEVALIIDHNGNAVASSDKAYDTQKEARSYSDLGSVGKVLAADSSGAGLQYVNGTQIHVTYAPIETAGNKWGILLMQPVEDAYSDVYVLQRQALVIIAIVVSIMGISGYLLFRSNSRNTSLSDKLEGANEELKRLNKDLNRDKASLEQQSKELQAKNERLEYLTAELNAAGDKLREIDRSKEEFSSMITHELKTPLVPIIGYGNLLLGGRLGDLTNAQKEKVSIIYDNAQRLSKLIQDVLDVRKLELGRLKLNIQEISANELIERSVNSFTTAAEVKGIKLENQLQKLDNVMMPLQVKCDPDRIHQVLDNLISNAIKFVPQNEGKIGLNAKLSNEDNSVIFSVTDNGIGISKENQTKLFAKFYQVDTSLTRNAGGTGLGLTIAKGIVEAHGGSLWVQSEEGKGSIFMFSLPLGGTK